MKKDPNAISMENIRRLAQSPAGQQLYAMLKAQNGAQLDTAMSQAASGDYSKAKDTLSALLSSPQVLAVLQQMKEGEHE